MQKTSTATPAAAGPKMTNAQLEAALRSLRVKETVTKVLLYAALAGVLLMWFAGKTALAVVFLVVAIVFAVLFQLHSSKLKALLSDNIVSGVLKEVLGDTVQYDPAGRLKPDAMAFPFSYNTVNGSDHIQADYKGLHIELSDIELVNKQEDDDDDDGGEGLTIKKTSTTCFKGQWLICDFGKELAGELRLSANDKTLRKRYKKDSRLVEMENAAFNERFLVLAGSAQEAYYILTPHVMEYILSMADKSGGDVYMSFLRDGETASCTSPSRPGATFLNWAKARPISTRCARNFWTSCAGSPISSTRCGPCSDTTPV